MILPPDISVHIRKSIEELPGGGFHPYRKWWLTVDQQDALILEVGSMLGTGLGSDLRSSLQAAGLQFDDQAVQTRHGHLGASFDDLATHTVAFVTAAGGLAGVAAILKTVFSRHKGKTVKFGEHGEILQADGLSVDDIVRLLDKINQDKMEELPIRNEVLEQGDEAGE